VKTEITRKERHTAHREFETAHSTCMFQT